MCALLNESLASSSTSSSRSVLPSVSPLYSASSSESSSPLASLSELLASAFGHYCERDAKRKYFTAKLRDGVGLETADIIFATGVGDGVNVEKEVVGCDL